MLVLLAAMLANGFVRVLVLEPRLGEILARQVATALGVYVADASWQQLLADYDVREGRFWPLVLLAVLLGPWLWGLAGPERRDEQPTRRII